MSGLRLTALCVPRVGFTIVREVDLHAPAGEVTVLLGPNGAGKTTLLEAVSGLIPSNGGKIELDGVDITRASRVRRARAGLAHVEQGRTVFAELTTQENLRVAAIDDDAERAALAHFPELEQRLHVAAGLLSGGEQQMLVIARALASRPSMLLVDEASSGLAPVIVRRLMPVFRQLADDGIGVLLVEQFAALALGIGDQGHVLNRGQIRLSGPCEELAAEPARLREAYLGAGQALADLPSAT
ncbi:MAG TPA: ABC transporter ATP-binding protein [Baekduia sp.]|jgi:branched-chain amino acid transport system ATP-binding protein